MKLLLGHFSLDADVSQQALVFSSFMGTVTRRKEIVQLSILNSSSSMFLGSSQFRKQQVMTTW